MRSSNRTIAHDLADILPPPPGTPFQRLRLLAASAFAVVGVFVIGFGFWATYAPLESAAIAGGTIEAESSRKTIQHLEGGIVGRILVKRRRRSDRRAAADPAGRYEGSRHRPSAPGAALGSAGPGGAPGGERDGRDAIQFPRLLLGRSARPRRWRRSWPGRSRSSTRAASSSHRGSTSFSSARLRRSEEIAALRFQVEAATKRAAIIKKETGDRRRHGHQGTADTRASLAASSANRPRLTDGLATHWRRFRGPSRPSENRRR